MCKPIEVSLNAHGRADVRVEAEKLYQKLYNLQHLSQDVEATFTWNRGWGNMNCPKSFVAARHVQFTVPNFLWASLGRIWWNRFPRKRYRHDRSPYPAFGRKICNEGSEILVLIFFWSCTKITLARNDRTAHRFQAWKIACHGATKLQIWEL